MSGGDAAAATMTHREFMAAFRADRIRVRVPPAPAAKFISARMLLPWVLLPMLGLSVACALLHAWVIAAILFGLALVVRGAVRITAAGYVLQRAMTDPAFYAEAAGAGLLEIDAGPAQAPPSSVA